MRPILLSVLLTLLSSTAAAEPWWDTDWAGRTKLSFDNAGRSNLDDFTVLVRIDSGVVDYGLTRNNGHDLRFVDPGGSLLSYEIEEWDEAGESIVWLEVPRIDGGSTVDHVWMYWGNGGANNGQDRNGTWSNGYVAVYHLNDSLDDATGGNNGNNQGSSNEPDFLFADGREFDGNDDHIILANESDFDLTTDLTIEGWFEVDQFDTTWQALITKGDSTWRIHRWGNGSGLAFGSTGEDGNHDIGTTTDVDDGQPHYFAATYTGGMKRLYLDGVEEANGGAKTFLSDNERPMLGENDEANDRYWDGWMDEIRVSSVARSADWVDAQHDSMTDALISFCDAPIEVCDGSDNDCDGLVDEDDPGLDPTSMGTWYHDVDLDGFGDPGDTQQACDSPGSGWTQTAGDCNDDDDTIHPDATEVCDGVDNDCDDDIDDDDGSLDLSTQTTWYRDRDTDSFGDGGTSTDACVAPDTDWVTVLGDCDDDDFDIKPGATEVCDDDDNDCDGDVDDDDAGLDLSTATTWYDDADSDDFGDPATAVARCDSPVGHVDNGDDCDDTRSAVNPDEDEICNDRDDDCDSLVDDADDDVDTSAGSDFFEDLDGDGFGDGGREEFCELQSGYSATDDDCDDSNAQIFPGAPEQCNDLDDDCDGEEDEDVTVETWYSDADLDGYGDDLTAVSDCASPGPDWVLVGGDCEPVNSNVNPGATEICNGIDDDCDGLLDDADFPPEDGPCDTGDTGDTGLSDSGDTGGSDTGDSGETGDTGSTDTGSSDTGSAPLPPSNARQLTEAALPDVEETPAGAACGCATSDRSSVGWLLVGLATLVRRRRR